MHKQKHQFSVFLDQWLLIAIIPKCKNVKNLV